MPRKESHRPTSRGPGILERLAKGVVLGDGGYLLELEKRGYVQAGPFTPEVVLEHPSAVKELHQEFLDAGAEVLQSLAFYASKERSRLPASPTAWARSTGPPCGSRGRSRETTRSWPCTSAWPGCTIRKTARRATRSALCSMNS